MQVHKSIDSWLLARKQLGAISIGFVPTMGALHQGHLELIEQSIQNNEHTVVSIFLNPTQFNETKDFENYPQTLNEDIELLRKAGVDTLILPDADEIYADKYRFIVSEKELASKLCGKHRHGHFDGVLTVVLKLFNIVRPQRAYFGKKDFQQYLLVQEMVRALFLDIEIVGCETVRAANGLALSSRNAKLSEAQIEKATLLYRALKSEKPIPDISGELEASGFKIDYIEDYAGRRLGAVWLGDVRLIDNVEKHSL
ncbi:MAG: pantoate--beta-alanine ligase [Myxococcales bacterium]|nr:pantoate--beta-alanine ligase [Myxococcales bacterium]|tara:strand:+ start:196 stop:960 length:765 start_codon:yes stop_codon:yes gene_type:complete